MILENSLKVDTELPTYCVYSASFIFYSIPLFLQEKLVATMSREELDLASCPEDAVSDMTKNRVSLFVGLTHTLEGLLTIICKLSKGIAQSILNYYYLCR